MQRNLQSNSANCFIALDPGIEMLTGVKILLLNYVEQ
jgi:hypothetical protein